MAGLSLAYYLTQSAWRDRSILLLDKEVKTQNDRTWWFLGARAGHVRVHSVSDLGHRELLRHHVCRPA